ncbi:hypothetical protein Tco_1221407 [Tanacetum coccineum]
MGRLQRSYDYLRNGGDQFLNRHGDTRLIPLFLIRVLNDIQLEGFSFSGAHLGYHDGVKLDRFLMSNGLLSAFPLISDICLDSSPLRPQAYFTQGSLFDFGPTPYVFITLGLSSSGFDDLVSKFAVKWFFDHGDFAIGCNSSFVALIPKVLDPKVLFGSHLVVKTAFLLIEHILEWSFYYNEILARCILNKATAMIFKVDFAKAYDSVRWDYLDDVSTLLDFGPNGVHGFVEVVSGKPYL